MRYVPALGYHALTPLYDGLVRWTTRERTFKAALVAAADLRAGTRALDVGCGTATLAIAMARAEPRASITGIDLDRRMLARARRKTRAADLGIELVQGSATCLPYREAAFDRVVSSLFFHHLDAAQKRDAIAEIRRVLKPGGELHVADWGKPQNAAMRAAFCVVQAIDGVATTRDHAAGRLPAIITGAGFAHVDEGRRFATPLGTLTLLRATC